MTIDEILQLAVAHHQAGRFGEAEKRYQQILAQTPDHPDALHLLGVVAAQTSRREMAINLITRAIAVRPTAREYYSNLGNVLRESGMLEEAVAAYRRAIENKPDSAEDYQHLGGAYSRLGQLGAAINAYRQAFRLKPNSPEIHNEFREALAAGIAAARQSVQRHPLDVEAHFQLGRLLREIGDSAAAIAALETALRINPNRPDIESEIGVAFDLAGQFDKAIAAHHRALRINPHFAEAHFNLGHAYSEMGRFDESLAGYSEAVHLKPDWPDAHWNLALALLLRGDFKRGWAEYEWRWRLPGSPSITHNVTQPMWDGGDLSGKTLLLRPEQGFGDTIQFIRYAPLLARRGGRLLLTSQPELSRLFQCMPEIQQVPSSPQLQFDFHCPLMRLPLIFGTTLGDETGDTSAHDESRLADPLAGHFVGLGDIVPEETKRLASEAAKRETEHLNGTSDAAVTKIPANIPYLKADSALVEAWGARLGSANGRLRVGLAWAGLPSHQNDRNRSMTLSMLAPLARVAGVDFFSLQKGPASSQAANPPPGMRLIDFTADLKDFADTAALMAHLDLIIAIDTSVVHLAGALGKTVWTLLPFKPDWRWLSDREDSPWYPTMRLFRQKSRGAWSEVIERVTQALVHFQSQVSKPAIEQRPAETHYNLGMTLMQQGKHEEAIAEHRQALRLEPKFADAIHALGFSLAALSKFDEAIAAYRNALAMKPAFPEALVNLGNAFVNTGKFSDAIAAYVQALHLDPNNCHTYFNLGYALSGSGNLDASVAAYRQALRLKPDFHNASNNLGNVLEENGQFSEAIAVYEQALQFHPQSAETHWNLGLALLLTGKFTRGWREVEWRWKWKDVPVPGRNLPQPKWDGSDLRGRTILLHAEQGFGDTIQLIRYVPMVAQRGGRILLSCPAALSRLLRSGFDVEQVPQGAAFPPSDVHCPLMTLPLIFDTQLETIPGSVPYLKADPVLIEQWAARFPGYIRRTSSAVEHEFFRPGASRPGVESENRTFAPTGPTRPGSDDHLRTNDLRVGLVWAGSKNHPNDHNRSMKYSQLAPLSKVTGVRFYSLQIGPAAAEIANTPAAFELIDFAADLHDFADTAALISHLDLIIAVDTAVAHVAGAMGKPVWVLLSRKPDWRWLLDRENSPWYPTLRLFRQTRRGDWAEVMERVADALLVRK